MWEKRQPGPRFASCLRETDHTGSAALPVSLRLESASEDY